MMAKRKRRLRDTGLEVHRISGMIESEELSSRKCCHRRPKFKSYLKMYPSDTRLGR